MKIIKLSAIDSTNDFLKNLARNEVVENYTTVVTQSQTKGKGQMGSTWDSESGKNLIMSVLIKDLLLNAEAIFHLNVAVSLAVIQVLEELKIPKISIKWPNDIMSDNKKIAGILIENSFKSDNRIESIVGIGLNVNQNNFSNLPKASSLAVITNAEFDLNMLLDKVLFQIKRNCALISTGQISFLWANYHDNLFKKGIPMAFEDLDGNQFMGIIQEVTSDGNLKLLLEDDSVKFYGVKQIQMLY
jgi:BirA family biotin operon repressor/biotin-[acetyl-CoA-carboxylase] ligase